MTVLDDKVCDSFLVFQGEQGLTFHANCLLTDDLHRKSSLIGKSQSTLIMKMSSNLCTKPLVALYIQTVELTRRNFHKLS